MFANPNSFMISSASAATVFFGLSNESMSPSEMHAVPVFMIPPTPEDSTWFHDDELDVVELGTFGNEERLCSTFGNWD